MNFGRTGDSSNDFVSLFDGSTLTGWHTAPRTYGTLWPGGPEVGEIVPLPDGYFHDAVEHEAVWAVVDGAIEGRQDPRKPGFGGYLVTDRTYGDFELVLEMKPDWPADTGVMLRRSGDSWAGYQVLVDHRESGSIGGFFGHGIAPFHAVPFALNVARDEFDRPIGLMEDDPAASIEPITQDKRDLLVEAGSIEDFLAAWKWADWNELRIRIVGAKPRISTWVNGVPVACLDAATLDFPNYDADVALELLGPRGHIALEVHDNDPLVGEKRWGPGSACRWRNIRIREL
jgi:hypothetical protein